MLVLVFEKPTERMASDTEERLIDQLIPVLLRQCGVTEQKPEIHRRNNRIE